jgi:hypothetical protein
LKISNRSAGTGTKGENNPAMSLAVIKEASRVPILEIFFILTIAVNKVLVSANQGIRGDHLMVRLELLSSIQNGIIHVSMRCADVVSR